MRSSQLTLFAGIAIGIVILTIPDYDGACKKAGACYLAGILLNYFFFNQNSDDTSSILFFILIVNTVLIIIYYKSFSFEMADRISAKSQGSSTFWKVIGITFLVGYSVMILLLLYLVTKDSDMSHSDAKNFVTIFKIDVYTILIAQIALIGMTLATGIMLKNYSEEPIIEDGITYPPLPGQPAFSQQPSSQPNMQPPHAQNGTMSPQSGQPNPQQLSAKSSDPSSISLEEERIRLLKEYKELLDSGVISQEEFEMKKAKLLNNK